MDQSPNQAFVVQTQSLGTIVKLPDHLDVAPTEPTQSCDQHCSICRLPLTKHTTFTLDPCGHGFHVQCYHLTIQMHNKRTHYKDPQFVKNKPHCPLCRAPTTTRVPYLCKLKFARKPLAASTTCIWNEFGSDVYDNYWKSVPTYSMKTLQSACIVPIFEDDTRWADMVKMKTPLYVLKHDMHGFFYGSTKKFIDVHIPTEVSTGLTKVRRFSKKYICGISKEWTPPSV